MTTAERFPHVFSKDAPRLVRAGAATYGVREIRGKRHSPIILGWAGEIERAIGASHLASRTLGYTNDEIPWCGLWMGVVALRADWEEIIPSTPLWARAWARTGVPAATPSFGDVLVFQRPGGGGHVGLYVGEAPGVYWVLGGNQGNEVGIDPIAKSRLVAARHPEWKVEPPITRRQIYIGHNGPLSTNEA
jgi:uncharacterized protein (TIGR02594 family)